MRTINDDGFTLKFDEQTGITYCIYGAIVNADVTSRLYMNGIRLMQHFALDTIHGIVFDFRAVEHFERNNIPQLQRESKRINTELPLSTIPVALLVATSQQKQVVGFGRNVTSEQFRKRVVHSMDEARAFFEAWHAGQSPNTNEVV